MIRRSMVENITVFLGFRAVTFISHGMSLEEAQYQFF